MITGQPPQRTGDSGRRLPLLWWITMAVVALAFFGVEHDLKMSVNLPTSEDYDVELDELTLAGSTLRKVSYSSLGLFAMLLLVVPAKRRWWPINSVVVLMVAYCGFCTMSLFWSDDPDITLRRLPILIFCFLAVIAVGKHFTAREVCWMIFSITGGYLLIGIAAELALGMFRPHVGDYRFSGTIHPNTQGINCSLLALAGLTLMRNATRQRWVLIAAVGLAVAILVLTKSRTSCAAFLVGAWLLYFFRLKGQYKPLAVFSSGFAVGVGMLVLLFASNSTMDQVQGAALLGRTEEASTFSGRLPLWNEVLVYVEDRPWLGYGYGAFWNVERVQAFVVTQGWQISHAHSGFFEPLANIGIVGVAIMVMTIFAGVVQAIRRYAVTRNEVYAFLVAQVAFGAVSSIGDAFYTIPSFCATVCAFTFASMAMTLREAQPVHDTSVSTPSLDPSPVEVV
jgi:O-antigen ligase